MKILNFGSCNIDYVYSLDHIVKNGETLSSDGLSIFPGGKGLNQSIALAKAGAEVYHAGCIGQDGEILTDILRENHVDLSCIRYVDAKNGHAIIQVNKQGENSIFLYSGSNEMIEKEHVDEVLAQFAVGDILLLQNEINQLEYLIEKAYQMGMCIMLNPSPCNEKIFRLDLHKVTYLILNEIEAKDITGCEGAEEALAFFDKQYPEMKIMLTLGKNGCIYRDKDTKAYHPIFEVDAVDTTAAGDTFTGYFAAGLAEGMDIKDILKMASCASAISVSRNGAAPSIPDKEEVIRGLKNMKCKGK